MRSLTVREIVTARAFYCDALGGEQVCRDGDVGADHRRLWFRVGSRVLEAGLGWRARARVTLVVNDPDEMVERCWDAGFTVRRCPCAGVPRSVTDPFGRQIDLVPSSAATGYVATDRRQRDTMRRDNAS